MYNFVWKMGLEDEMMRGMLDCHKCRGDDCYANTDLCKFESSPDSCDTVLSSVYPIGATKVANESIR